MDQLDRVSQKYVHFKDVIEDALSKSGSKHHQTHPQLKESESEAHQLFRAAPGHSVKNERKLDDDEKDGKLPGIVEPAATGVIYVMNRASANGFSYDDPEWANFGQGAPEVGELPGATPRPGSIDISAMGSGVNEYAPTAGVRELREAVANLYNTTYRQGKASKYTHENVCIVPGGRAGLIRVAAVIGDVYCAYQIPEYTAYSSMLSIFKRLVPVPTALSAEDKYKLHTEKLKKTIHEMGISVIVLSNPRNPTGQCIKGDELKDLVGLAKQGTTVILDEFYSWYQYDEDMSGKSVSAAAYIDDVNEDPVVLIDGLTKNFRLPGWRCCWVVGPKDLVTALGSSGSYLDGGASHPTQLAAIPLLDPARVQQDKLALQRCFKEKRDYVLHRLEEMGLKVEVPPSSTFYIWLDLSTLPSPLNSGLVFFEEALKEKTIVVPGLFFDINPSHRRNLFDSPCQHFVRLSFGPPMEELKRGLDGIQRLLDRARSHYERDGHLHGGMGKGYRPSDSEDSKRGSLNAKASGS